MTQLTNPRIFEPRHLCTGCGLDLADYTENTPAGPCKHPDFDVERVNYFVPGAAMMHDIHLKRIPGTGPAECGNALVDIDRPFVYHSPDGYEWGYGGSGPADLALNVLALFVPPAEAWRLHQHYKRDVIAPMPREGGTITADSVREWIRAAWAKEAK